MLKLICMDSVAPSGVMCCVNKNSNKEMYLLINLFIDKFIYRWHINWHSYNKQQMFISHKDYIKMDIVPTTN